MKGRNLISAEEKLRAVEDYLSGGYTLRQLGARYNIHHSNISKWMLLYQTWGKEGLERKPTSHRYSDELKEEVIKTYLTTNCSLYDLCRKYKVRNFSTVQFWLSKADIWRQKNN